MDFYSILFDVELCIHCPAQILPLELPLSRDGDEREFPNPVQFAGKTSGDLIEDSVSFKLKRACAFLLIEIDVERSKLSAVYNHIPGFKGNLPPIFFPGEIAL